MTQPKTTDAMMDCPLRQELERCQGIFARYADLHACKNTEDGNAKAAVNLMHANRIAVLLSNTRPDPKPQIPEGYVLVPREPTEEMIESGWPLAGSECSAVYISMIEASDGEK